MKNKTIFESIKYAISGIILAFKEERNLGIYVIIALVFLSLNIILKSTYIELIIYVILCALVFATEYINTAIERVVDKFILTKNPDAKYIKDVSAASVLTFGITFFIIEALILIPKIIS